MANLPPSTADGKAARGGTMLDQLQVTLTPAGAYRELQEVDVTQYSLYKRHTTDIRRRNPPPSSILSGN